MAKQKQPAADPTLLAASTWNAIVEGWELQNQREIARANAPQTINMSKLRMRMSGGSYGAGSSVPRDPTTGVPIP
jgi:hypothetical protein